MYCKIDGKKLVKAHLIPEFLLRSASDEHGRIMMVERRVKGQSGFDHRVRPRNKPGLDIDVSLTCRDCEARLQGWEDYAKRVLLDHEGIRVKQFQAQSPTGGGTIWWEEFHGLDYQRVKLFVLSMVWRLSVSDAQIALQVSLGPHEERIWKMLQAGDAGEERDYAIHMYKLYLERAPLSLSTAFTERGATGYVVHILAGGYWFIARISKHALPKELRTLGLKRDGLLRVPILNALDVPMIRAIG